MFINFFFKLKEIGVPVSPTSFLRLHRAMTMGLVNSVEEFYTTARTILIKSERYFDIYDQVFAWYFKGVEIPEDDELILDEMAKAMLDEWLQNPKEMAQALGEEEEKLSRFSPDELIDYFKKRLKDQKERHDGGSKWIGTGGYSPVGHSGYHPGGMRVGGQSKNKSAVKLAGERRYKEYSGYGPLTQAHIGEALKRLRNLVPSGPRDAINVDKSIYQTMKNGGEIEIVFDQSLRDRLKVVLMIDNGGWSMDPYVNVVQTLFDYARAQFKDLKTYFFHNTIYDTVWLDASRYRKPKRIDEFAKIDPDTRLIILGDASMAPYELLSRDGSIYVQDRSGKPSIERLRFLSETFENCVWLNPVQPHMWEYTRTIQVIRQIFPMYELSLDGLEAAVTHLMQK
ncbi:MAG: hypothetical protein MI742_13190 [Desulfobacterales bacterium]|nr:hypothetical protein [Desulfobacterales bacterium]